MLNQAIAFGRYRLDARGGLTLGTREVRLTPKALAVLCVLAERPGRLVTKDELFGSVWPETTVGDSALVTCIQELRKALRDDARRPRYIETLHRRGYRFIGKPASSPPRPDDVGDQRIEPEQDASIVVGRDRELARLGESLARARAGERQIVFVTGEPGIGKTSLVRTFIARAREAGDVDVAWGQSAEHYGASEPYLPLIEALVRSCRGASGERLVGILDRHAPTWLAQMPSLLGAGQLRELRRRTAGVTRERMLRELTDALEAAAEQTPIVLWLEDLHWGDISTTDWLASFARRPDPARLLLIGTYRPVELLVSGHPLHGMQDELRRYKHCREIALPPLSRAAVSQYLAARYAPAPDAADELARLAEQVHQRTEGSPLFMVGVLDDLVDQGVLENADGQWTVRHDAETAELGIPKDLQRLIERQLDRLDRAELRLLEVASVVGANFSAAAVAAGAGLSVADVETMCSDIARRQQLIRAAGAEEWPDGTVSSRFGFHHALYREALYERLPAGRRVELHRRAGERLEQAHQDRADEIAGELAMHFERGRDIRRAVRYLHRAGRGARHRGAAHQAAAYFARALDLIATLPKDRARDESEAELRVALCVPLIALHGYGSAAVEACAIEAKTLSDSLPDFRGRFAAGRFVWNASVMRHPVAKTTGHARELMELARATNHPAQLALAHRALGTSLKLAGELRQAGDVLARGMLIADGVCDDDFAHYGEHPGPICRAFGGWAKALMGFLDDGARLADEGIEHARRGGDPHGLAFGLVSSGMVYLFLRDVARIDQIAAETIALATEFRLPQWLGFGQELKGWATLRSGDPAEGIRLQEEGLQRLRGTGAKTHTSRMHASLAESYLLIGKPDMARTHLGAACAHRDAHGERYYAPELVRLRALLLAHEGADPEEIEACLLEAIEIARNQEAGLHALRAATSLARFRAERGRRDAARNVLAPAHAAVTGGSNSPDVAEARALLSHLHG